MPQLLFLLFLGLVAVPPSGAVAPGTFTLTGEMSSARSLHTATLLGDGRVLVCGGADATFQALSTAEIYDPLTATFSPTGPMGTARFAANATLLPDGRVLIVGGEDSGNVSTTSVELFNPATGTFSLTGSLLVSRLNPTVTMLGNGLVLVAGGYEGTSTGTPLASAELYDPASGTFSLTGSMDVARRNHTATLLPDATVLVAGGYNGTYVNAPEVYQPSTGLFVPTGDMSVVMATLVTNSRRERSADCLSSSVRRFMGVLRVRCREMRLGASWLRLGKLVRTVALGFRRKVVQAGLECKARIDRHSQPRNRCLAGACLTVRQVRRQCSSPPALSVAP